MKRWLSEKSFLMCIHDPFIVFARQILLGFSLLFLPLSKEEPNLTQPTFRVAFFSKSQLAG